MYDEITLSNGLRIIGQHMPSYRSVSVGIWVKAGSEYEQPEENGITHFIEHMLFKGTKHRTARQIAEEMDAVGGQLNAFTAKECTCFYAKVLDENMPLAIDVLCDMIRNPLFDKNDMAHEKGVVLEEIDMAEDTPDDAVSELIVDAQFGNQAVSRPILGTHDTVSSFTREAVLDYFNRMYCPETIVISIAGHYDWDSAVEMISSHFADWDKENIAVPEVRTQPSPVKCLRREKDIEQLHICLGYPGVKIGSDDIYSVSVLCSVFGGAMSSRLFQRIREEKGMAYTVYSYVSSYLDCGALNVYAGTSTEHAAEVMRMIKKEAEELAEHGLTDKEFRETIQQLKAGVLLGNESTSARMRAIGRRKLLIGNAETEDDVISRIDAITYESVNERIREILTAPVAVAVLGKGAESVEVPF